MSTAQASPGTRDSIEAQLDRILSAPEFRASERISNFLRFIVQEALDGRGDRLKGYTIGVQVFDRDESFDPQTDSIVRVEAGRLRRMLNQYYLTDGSEDPLRIHLPKGGYVPEFQDLAEPRKDPSAATQARATPSPCEPRQSRGKPFVAVLAFDNMSGDPAQDYFCDGMSEEIITELCRFQGLCVIARNSSFQYKGKHLDVRQIGRELNVQFVLEGSVRKAADQIKVSAQLIDAGSGEHLWAESFHRDLTVQNILDVQANIAAQVVARTADASGAIARAQSDQTRHKGTDSLDAYEHMLRFYEYVNAEGLEKHGQIREGLERAVEIDPGYSDAWAALAWVYGDEFRFNFNRRSEEYDPLRKALDAANRAVRLNPASALAHQHLCLIQFCLGNIELFRSHLERALDLSPNNTYLLADAGVHLAAIGDWDRSTALIDRAVALNPTHPGWYNFAPFLHAYHRGEYQDAYRYATKFQSPELFWSHAMLAAACAQLGQRDKAHEAVKALLAIYPDFEDNVRFEMGKWHFCEPVYTAIIDGFEKAGLAIAQR